MAPPGTTSDIKQNPELEALLEDELEKGKEGVNPESETAPRRLRQFRRVFLWAFSLIALVHIFVKRIVPLLHYQLQQYQVSAPARQSSRMQADLGTNRIVESY